MPAQKQHFVISHAPRRRTHKIFPALVIGLLTLGALFIAGSVLYSITLRGKIYPGVSFGNRSIGRLTYSVAERVITDQIAQYSTRPLIFRDGQKVWRASASELGIGFDVAATLDTAKQIGRGDSWLNSLISPVYAIGGGDVIRPALIINQGVIEDYLDRLSQSADQPARPVRFAFRDDYVSTLPGRNGEKLDAETARAELFAQLERLQPVELSLSFNIDEVPTGLGLLEKLRTDAEKLIRRPLRLVAGETTVQIAPDMVARWLMVTRLDEATDWSVTLDRITARKDLESQLSGLNHKPEVMKTYKAAENVTPIVDGKDGQSVALEATLDSIEQNWLSGKSSDIQVALTVVQRPVEFLEVTAPHTEGKSILVDLTRQTAFAFKDGTLQFFTLASTGKFPRPTPTGEFHVYSKSRRQKMSGPGYYLPNVQWVMFYSGDYSLHGTYWHNNFGHPMSHGCTNLSNESAERFFNFGERGTPVTIIGETPRS